jgi:hypothetical protein
LENTLNDWADIISAGMKFAPAAGIVLLAALVVWLFWRGVRRILRAFGSRSHTPQDVLERSRPFERREPILEPAAAQNPPAVTSSDILALKASIDALTRQIADLSGKLAAADETRLHAANRPSPVMMGKEDNAVSVERRAGLAQAGAVSLAR